jgi:hypothetical protein
MVFYDQSPSVEVYWYQVQKEWHNASEEDESLQEPGIDLWTGHEFHTVKIWATNSSVPSLISLFHCTASHI